MEACDFYQVVYSHVGEKVFTGLCSLVKSKYTLTSVN